MEHRHLTFALHGVDWDQPAPNRYVAWLGDQPAVWLYLDYDCPATWHYSLLDPALGDVQRRITTDNRWGPRAVCEAVTRDYLVAKRLFETVRLIAPATARRLRSGEGPPHPNNLRNTYTDEQVDLQYATPTPMGTPQAQCRHCSRLIDRGAPTLAFNLFLEGIPSTVVKAPRMYIHAEDCWADPTRSPPGFTGPGQMYFEQQARRRDARRQKIQERRQAGRYRPTSRADRKLGECRA